MEVMSGRKIVSLVAVAPFCRDGGQHRGKRIVWGGRWNEDRDTMEPELATNPSHQGQLLRRELLG